MGRVLAVVALGWATLAPLALLSALPAAAVTLGTAQVVPGALQLQGVSCPSATGCLAVGYNDSFQGVMVPIINGIPGAAQVVPGTGPLNGVSCPSATTCLAVGDDSSFSLGAVVPIINGIPGAAQVVPGTEELNGVSCPSATTCLAVGDTFDSSSSSFQGLVVPITNGIPGAAQVAPGSGIFRGVSCPSATTCEAVGADPSDAQGVVVPITNGTPGTAQVVSETRELEGVSCPSATTCQAVGQNPSFEGVVVPITNGTAGNAQVVPETVVLNGVSCPSATTCHAVGSSGSQGLVLPIMSGIPGTAQVVPGTAQLFGVSCSSATTCEAVGLDDSYSQGVVVTITSPPADTISTQASPGNLLGAPVSDTATLSGTSNPIGSVTFSLFSDAGCATQVFTSTNNLSGLGATSDSFTPAAAGTYYWTAAYSGDANNNAVTSACGAANESVVIAPFTAPTPTRTITGNFTGPLTVNAGESVLLTNARVIGPVTVNPGGALTVVTSQVTGGIVANGPSFFSVCGSQISAPTATPSQGIVVSGAAVPIRIGDPATGCALNRVAGDVSLTGNSAGLTLGANFVSGNVTVSNNAVGTDVVKANNVFKALACAGNSPAPTNAGQPNTAGSKSGQCAAL